MSVRHSPNLPPHVQQLLHKDLVRRRAESIAAIRFNRRWTPLGSWMGVLVAIGVCSILPAFVEVELARKGVKEAAAFLRLVQVIGNFSAAIGMVLTFLTRYKLPMRYPLGFSAAYFATNPAVDAQFFFKNEARDLISEDLADFFFSAVVDIRILGFGLILCLVILAAKDILSHIFRYIWCLKPMRRKWHV